MRRFHPKIVAPPHSNLPFEVVMVESVDGDLVRYADHAAELAEWKQRAERAEAYVAGQDEWSNFRNAREMHDALVKVTSQRDSLCLVFKKAQKENALLRAECEAWREVDAACKRDFDDDYDGPSGIDEAGEMLTKARAATDAAGILKGGE